MTRSIIIRSTKLLLLCAGVSILTNGKAGAQVFVSEDFNSANSPGLPAGWISAPASQWTSGAPDVITPNALQLLHLSLNNAAHTKAVGIDGTQAAADGAILASPVISLPATAVNTILKYDVAYFGMQSSNPPRTEGFVFIVSTDGGATWSDVSFVAPLNNPQNNLWETRSLPMGAYAGQTNLKFGFRYNNEGGTLIGAVLDNIRLINGTDATVISASAGDHPDPAAGTGYQVSGTSTTLTGTIQNTGAATINSYYIRYKVGAGPVQSSPLISGPVASLGTASFPPGLTVSIPANESYSIKAWIDATGDVDHHNDTAVATTVGVPYLPIKRPVFEEGTGTWCGWCPRGAVFMDHFAASHPGGAATQIAVHNGDPMTLPDYNTYMANYAGGFPNLVIDRSMLKDPRDIDSAFTVAQNNFGFADITLGLPVFNGSTVAIPVAVKPVVTITNPKLALVVTESNVREDGWLQNNYYAGGGSGDMGGWEHEAAHVPDVHFHFVARSITPAPDGSAGDLPATLIAGTTYNTTLTATLNNSDWKINDLQYIALLMNGNTAAVMNSASTALPGLLPALGSGTVITDVERDIPQVMLYPNPASGKSYLRVSIKSAGRSALTLSDITGRTCYSKAQQLHSGNNIIDIETAGLAPGSYFLNFTTGRANVVRKLQVVKQAAIME